MPYRPLRALVLSTLCSAALAAGCTTRDPVVEKAEAVRRGDAHLAENEYAAAATAYRAAVQADPRDGVLRSKLARAYESAGNYARATEEAMRAADLVPDNQDMQLHAVRLMLGQQRFIDARDRAAALLARNPNDTQALILWGNAVARIATPVVALEFLSDLLDDHYLFTARRAELRPGTPQSDDAAAEEALRKALRLAPASMDAQVALVNFLWITGRPDAAETLLRAVADANPTHGLANYALGRLYLARGRGADAERYLEAGAALDGSGADARLALADYYLGAQRDAEAHTLLTTMLEKDAGLAREVALRLARVEFRGGRRQEALTRLDGVLAAQPAHAEALLLKAQLLVESRDWERALPLARTALAQSPQSSAAHATLGDVFAATGDLEAARSSYAEAFRLNPADDDVPIKFARILVQLGRGTEAVQTARDAKRRDPSDPAATLALAEALALTGEFAAAESELRPLVEDTGGTTAGLEVLLGKVRAGRGNRAGARAAFSRALQLDASSIDAIAGLVALDIQENQLATARQRVDRALATRPDDIRLLLLSADVAAAANQFTVAEPTLRRVLAADGSHRQAAIALADVLARQERSDDARTVLTEFLKRRPRSTDVRTRLGRLLEDAGKLEDARTQYEQIVAEDPRAARAASRLAAVHVELKGNLDVALDLAILAKQQMPRDADVAHTLGLVYFARNVMGRALPHLRDAVRADPQNPVYHFRLGQVYLQTGDRNKAREELTKALTLDRNFRHADQTRQLLASLG